MSPLDERPRRRYRVLAVSDKVEPLLYGPSVRSLAAGVDFIIGCGDLPYYYLEFIASMLDRPLYFVHGNHDRPEHRANMSIVASPPGAINLHRRITRVEGLLCAGLEGSHRYNHNAEYQYSQSEMQTLTYSLFPALMLNRLLHGRALDVLITHSPPFGIHDATDRPHIGFRAFLPLLRWFRPRYLLHGHQHVYRNTEITETRYLDTTIINVYPFRILDLEFPTTDDGR